MKNVSVKSGTIAKSILRSSRFSSFDFGLLREAELVTLCSSTHNSPAFSAVSSPSAICNASVGRGLEEYKYKVLLEMKFYGRVELWGKDRENLGLQGASIRAL
jgi:hypothetical protein